MVSWVSRIEFNPLSEPAGWSILRQTITNLFQINDADRNSILDAADEYSLSNLDLPDEEWVKIARVAIYKDDSFYDLLCLSLEYYVDLGITPKTFDSIVEHFKALCKGLGVPITEVNTSNNVIVTDTDIEALDGFRIDSFSVPTKLAEKLGEMGLNLWKDLSAITERNIFDSSNSYLATLQQIQAVWLIKSYAESASSKLSESASGNLFSEMVKQFFSSACKNQQDMTILLGRIGLLEGGRRTLDELGKKFDLTRERVRQIEAKKIKLLNHCSRVPIIAAFKLATTEILQISGGVCFIDELAKGLKVKMSWVQEPDLGALERFIVLFGGVKYDEDSRLVFNPEHRCVGCGSVISALEEIFTQDKNEKTIKVLKELIRSYCEKNDTCNKYSKILSFSDGFIHCIVDKYENLLIDEKIVYRRDMWNSKAGTRERIIESVLKKSGGPMHFNEVYNQVLDLLPRNEKISKHSIHAALGRYDYILLWDRGTFVHCNNIKMPSELINEIESWLSVKLNNGVPFISITGAFERFKECCSESNIISETALYTCLRKWGNSKFYYPKYPQIYLRSNFEACVPHLVAVEQFIRDADGEVSHRALQEYVLEELFLKEFQLQQCIMSLTGVARTKSGGFLYIDEVNIDIDKFSILVDYIQQLLTKEESVSAARVFSEKCVTCTVLKIDGPQMLFSLLRVMCPEKFGLDRYPLIHLNNNDSTKSLRGGVISQVADYIQRKLAPCSFDELETHFVTEKRFSEQIVYSVQRMSDIVRFGRGTLVHIDTLDWTADKQHQIEAQARKILDQAHKAGRCYARANDFFEFQYDQLPILANHISWTPTLLGELLNRTRHFRFLGNLRNAFVVFPNEEGIEIFEDLIYELLKTKFEGASEISTFEEYLRKEGIIIKSLTRDMMSRQNKVIITEHLIMLKELNRDA